MAVLKSLSEFEGSIGNIIAYKRRDSDKTFFFCEMSLRYEGRCARLHIGQVKQIVHHDQANMMICV